MYGSNPLDPSKFQTSRLGRKIIDMIENNDLEHLKIVYLELNLQNLDGKAYSCILDSYNGYISSLKLARLTK